MHISGVRDNTQVACRCLLGISTEEEGRWGTEIRKAPDEDVKLAVFNRMAREGHTGQVTFAQRLEGSKRGKPCGCGGRALQARTKFLCGSASSHPRSQVAAGLEQGVVGRRSER